LHRPVRPPVTLVLAGVLAAALTFGVTAGLAARSVNDARVQAAQWVEGNVPAGSHVLVERYSPWVDPVTYNVKGITMLIRAPIPPETDYVIASEAIFGRYTDHPDQFPDEAARYEQLFDSLRLVEQFPNGEASIRIYAVPSSP